MNLQEKAKQMKFDSMKLAAKSEQERNNALEMIAQALLVAEDKILEANDKDMKAAEEAGIAAPVLKRLRFDKNKLNEVTAGIRELIKLRDPLGKIQLERELDEGLKLFRTTCPIGVIGVIFESRPDAMVQISSLCLKSGNCAILKGGSEALHTNRILFETIHNAAIEAGMPENSMLQIEAREDINTLLGCHDAIDLLIPRGSNAFVQYIMNNTKIPVMGHADGICHIYVDKEADVDKAVRIIVDAKTQYVAVCNAVENLLVHKDIAAALMPKLKAAFDAKNVELRGTKEIQDIVDCVPATDEDFSTEYLDYILSAKTVDGFEEAVWHINKFGSHHTDCIVTENRETAEQFMQLVDSAGVYQNCSTRFADGFRYGFGAEVGVSTVKLHARGPVGLDGLVTYKYKLFGDGHIVADYAQGIRKFNFKDIIV
ncbi:MAG: glutamate-5-semialdehyde dehydrogenase [Lachnospiraceae bacterium]|nr:glutamate-5-semialdehyde dehydrogenase [Lachnospiraceae bacterium]